MKILSSDFDNTLFFLDDPIKTAKNIEAVKKFIASGNIFCIITGRTYMEIKPDLLKLDLPYTYLVCADGALIFDSTDYCLKTVKLDKEVVKRAVEILKENGWTNIQLETKDYDYTPQTNICDLITQNK